MSRCASCAVMYPTLGTHSVFKLLNSLSIGALSQQIVFLRYTESGSGANHNQIHTDLYYETVNRLVLQAKTRSEVENVLKQVADQLGSGTFLY